MLPYGLTLTIPRWSPVVLPFLLDSHISLHSLSFGSCYRAEGRTDNGLLFSAYTFCSVEERFCLQVVQDFSEYLCPNSEHTLVTLLVINSLGVYSLMLVSSTAFFLFRL